MCPFLLPCIGPQFACKDMHAWGALYIAQVGGPHLYVLCVTSQPGIFLMYVVVACLIDTPLFSSPCLAVLNNNGENGGHDEAIS